MAILLFLLFSQYDAHHFHLLKERMKDDEDFRFMRFSPRMRIVGADFGVQIPAAAIDGKLVDYLLSDDVSLLVIVGVVRQSHRKM